MQMTEITVANRTPIPELIGWLTEHGVDYVADYILGMAGAEQTSGDIHFYPKFSFDEGVDELILTEFSLRFS